MGVVLAAELVAIFAILESGMVGGNYPLATKAGLVRIKEAALCC